MTFDQRTLSRLTTAIENRELGPRTATVIGVLEPSLPYPVDTDIIANMVTSPHHMGATMNITNSRRGITVTSSGGTIDTQGFNLTWAGPMASTSN